MTIKKAILTEKTSLQERRKIYTFSVSPNLNKYQIRKELMNIFPKMEIKKIRTCRYKPVLQKLRNTKLRNRRTREFGVELTLADPLICGKWGQAP